MDIEKMKAYLFRKGLFFLTHENYTNALKCFRGMLKFDPNDKKGIEYLILTHSMMPDFNQYLTRIGILFGRKKKYKEAQNYFLTSIMINPCHAY